MKNTRFLLFALLLTLTLALSACARATAPNFAEVPAGKAYVAGQEIFFTHTEVSDAQVGELLTNMMNSPVIVVPSLTEAIGAAQPVYVFTNGIAGSGPFKFQADVFPNQPGDADYTPLRRVVLVTWTDQAQASELKSEEEILRLVEQGQLTLEETQIVVNMPFITWKDGGKR
jgi:hypothetical protein